MEIRAIQKSVIEKTVLCPGERFYDVITGTEIAIGIITVENSELPLIVAYTVRMERFFIVTAYPCKRIEKMIEKRVREKRWIKIE